MAFLLCHFAHSPGASACGAPLSPGHRPASLHLFSHTPVTKLFIISKSLLHPGVATWWQESPTHPLAAPPLASAVGLRKQLLLHSI